ncbi:GATA zinc finger domain-containing protein 15-like [Harmonia axyridis]|uniref:GATA zinc finger domain-containing protein 15-like n=1 Tax=Harmonia axyridis TaxID=115357 RepID=UPI001E2779D9|nr:GATA zinc finger domain-containing protein 15-like [Harmonia axyridis]
MKNMRLASRNNPVTPSEMPTMYINNPRIMKIVNDSYGNMNRKFNPGQVQSSSNFPQPFENCHYMLAGNTFVPVAMDTLLTEPQVQKKFSSSFSTHQKNATQSMVSSTNNKKNRVSLMKLPVPNQSRTQANSTQISDKPNHIPLTSTNNNELNKSMNNNEDNKSKNYQVKTIFCTGTIERILRWNRILEDVFCMYETIAPIVSLQEGRIKNQKIMLLRDKKGPILQVHYYNSTHIDIDDFCIGQYLRCVGRMIGFNILSAESIRQAKESEMSTLARLSYVCDYSITHNLNTV